MVCAGQIMVKIKFNESRQNWADLHNGIFVRYADPCSKQIKNWHKQFKLHVSDIHILTINQSITDKLTNSQFKTVILIWQYWK